MGQGNELTFASDKIFAFTTERDIVAGTQSAICSGSLRVGGFQPDDKLDSMLNYDGSPVRADGSLESKED